MKSRRGDIGELLPWIILAVLLIVIFFSYFIISGKTNSAIEFFRNLVRFGR